MLCMPDTFSLKTLYQSDAAFALQSSPAPNVEACNAKGQSIQHLAAAALSLSSGANSDSEPSTSSQPAAKRARIDHANAGLNQWESAEELEWQARLTEESGAELRGADEDDWDRYG